jgi:hypothetical protein
MCHGVPHDPLEYPVIPTLPPSLPRVNSRVSPRHQS